VAVPHSHYTNVAVAIPGLWKRDQVYISLIGEATNHTGLVSAYFGVFWLVYLTFVFEYHALLTWLCHLINELILAFINYYVCLSAKICQSNWMVSGSGRESGPVFFPSPWFLPVFRLVPISGILCVFCSIHLLSYIISSIQVSNFMSHDIPSEISNCVDHVGRYLKGDVAIHAKHKTIYICLYLILLHLRSSCNSWRWPNLFKYFLTLTEAK